MVVFGGYVVQVALVVLVVQVVKFAVGCADCFWVFSVVSSGHSVSS